MGEVGGRSGDVAVYEDCELQRLGDRLMKAVAFGIAIALSDAGNPKLEDVDRAERYFKLMRHFAQGGYSDSPNYGESPADRGDR